MQSDSYMSWDPGENMGVSAYLSSRIHSLSVSSSEIKLNYSLSESRTELDTHANMPLVGRHCCVIAHTGRSANIHAILPDFPTQLLSIVNAAIKYKCPFSGKEYALLIRNSLYVPLMTTNLLPPFVLREHCITVNNCLKIHVSKPTVNNHAISIPEIGLRIPLKLHGVFLYFYLTVPTSTFLHETENVFQLTPD